MAHALAPQPPDSEVPVFFNVDGVVGALPAQNLREDVLLVQFAFKVIVDSPRPTTPAEVLTAARAVRLTGSIDAETINAIRVVQQRLKRKTAATVVDGRVSRARGGYSYGGGADWTIVTLNAVIQERNKDTWPRIDKIRGCPRELRQMVVRTVAGS